MSHPLHCPGCKLTFDCPKDLSTHVEDTHKCDGEYICNDCGKAYPKQSALRSHFVSHTKNYPFKCTLCCLGKINSAGMEEHILITHFKKIFFKCLLCDASFTNEHSMHNHLSSHDQSRHFLCQICGKTILHKYKSDHMDSHEGISQKCAFCGKSFSRRGLAIHIKAHCNGLNFHENP